MFTKLWWKLTYRKRHIIRDQKLAIDRCNDDLDELIGVINNAMSEMDDIALKMWKISNAMHRGEQDYKGDPFWAVINGLSWDLAQIAADTSKTAREF